jgi:hypothetical protein
MSSWSSALVLIFLDNARCLTFGEPKIGTFFVPDRTPGSNLLRVVAAAVTQDNRNFLATSAECASTEEAMAHLLHVLQDAVARELNDRYQKYVLCSVSATGLGVLLIRIAGR